MKKISVFAEKLQQMKEQATTAMTDYSPGIQKVPDGIYFGKEGAEIKESKTSGRMMVARRFTITEGEYIGRQAFDNIVFQDNDVGWQILRRWVETHGYNWPDDNLAALEDLINDIDNISPVVKFQVKTTQSKTDDREFTNIIVLEVMEIIAKKPEQKEEKKIIKKVVKKEDSNNTKQLKTDLLIEFAASQGIDGINEEMSIDEIKNILSGYEFLSDELTQDEKSMLDALGLSGNVKE